MGACAAIRSSLGEPTGGLWALGGTVQACQHRLAVTLGDRLSQQESAGANLSTDEAIAYALEWLQ